MRAVRLVLGASGVAGVVFGLAGTGWESRYALLLGGAALVLCLFCSLAIRWELEGDLFSNDRSLRVRMLTAWGTGRCGLCGRRMIARGGIGACPTCDHLPELVESRLDAR